jgi:hypothetical protein
MQRIASFLILAVLSGGGVGLSSAQPLRAEIRHAKATPYDIGDFGVAAFNLKFDVRLTNESERPVEILKADTGREEMTRVVVIGVQTKLSDGTWAHVIQSSWYGPATIRYEALTSVPPGGAAELTNLTDRLVLLNKQLAGLGMEPTVRFTLMIFCRAEGKVVMKTVRTEEFELRLPARL